MKVTLATVTSRIKAEGISAYAAAYRERLSAYASVSSTVFRSADALFQSVEKQRGRTSAALVLLDSRGRLLSSEEFAAWVGEQRDAGQQEIVFAIGPADGWSEAARKKAALLLSFGRMTMPHELMRVVLAEQIYRAFTILSGHPYHSGHSG